jgi:hypothetical protein
MLISPTITIPESALTEVSISVRVRLYLFLLAHAQDWVYLTTNDFKLVLGCTDEGLKDAKRQLVRSGKLEARRHPELNGSARQYKVTK